MGYSFFNLAYDVLKQANRPLSIQEIWENANKMGLVEKLSSSGKTPVNTLSARLSVDVKHNNNPTFKKVDDKPSRYILNNGISSEIPHDILENVSSVSKHIKSVQNRFTERDLHIILSSYVRANEHFGCLTKTIYHEVSKRRKNGINKWLHPDIVGVHFPFESYTENTLKLFDILKCNMFNIKEPNCNNCIDNRKIFYGECSYIISVTWDDFIKNPEDYINRAYKIQNSILQYNVVKEI